MRMIYNENDFYFLVIFYVLKITIKIIYQNIFFINTIKCYINLSFLTHQDVKLVTFLTYKN